MLKDTECIIFLNIDELYRQTLNQGTSIVFTYRRFDSIQVVLPATPAGTYQGAFCITVRYPIS
ncbi:DUF3992 domain-containing protein [Bacillus clarus]|uniref:DUF3992 domain-containing protein n=1 Tax=Bacillus clarus TaxID=2338372 RepID=UPI00216B50A5|nr:DUF3992 domain-containing protein [Bacillus clarus]